MAQMTVTDTATGAQKPIDVGPVNTLAISNQDAPTISAGDVALARAQQTLQPLPSHDPLEPAPSHTPDAPLSPVLQAQARDAGEAIGARPPMERDPTGSGMRIPATWADQNYGHLQDLRSGIGSLTEPLHLTDYTAQQAQYGVPDSPVKQQQYLRRMASGLNIAGMAEPDVAPLRGFYSKFETEVLPRLSANPQHPQKVQNLVEKFVPKDQWEWMGGPEWLKSQNGKPVTKAQVAEWFTENQPKFKETVLGARPAFEPGYAEPAKWQQYTLPGGSEYHERLVSVPPKPIPAHAIAPMQWESTTEPAVVSRVGRGMELAGPVTHHTLTHPALYNGSTTITDYSQHPAWANYDTPVQFANGSEHPTVEAAKTAVEVSTRIQAETAARREMTYTHSHFSDVKDYFLHLRNKVRDIVGVGKTLFGDEFQSDAHQAGRYNGYKEFGDAARASERAVHSGTERQRQMRYLLEAEDAVPTSVVAQADAYARATTMSPKEISAKVFDPAQRPAGDETPANLAAFVESVRAHIKDTSSAEAAQNAPPNMPFKKTWQELALRMQIRDAVDRGMDAIGWTTGQQQLDRYRSALQHVGSVTLRVTPSHAGSSMYLEVEGLGGEHLTGKDLNSLDEVADVVGATQAKRLLAQPERPDGFGDAARWTKTLAFDKDHPFTIGGKGMLQEYDEQIPAIAEKIGKPFGAKPEQVEMVERVPKPKARHGRDASAFNEWMDRDGHVIAEPPEYFEPDYDSEPTVPDETPMQQMEGFEASYDWPHWVHTDPSEFESNADAINKQLDAIRAANPDLFGHDPAKPDLVDIGRAHPDTALRHGVQFDAVETQRLGGGSTWSVVARDRSGHERPVVIPDMDAVDDEGVAHHVAESLNAGGAAEPTQWRFQYSDSGRGAATSDWYDSEEDAVRAAEEKSQELDDEARSEEESAEFERLTEEYAEAQQQHEAWEEAQERQREEWHRARDVWEEQGHEPWEPGTAVTPAAPDDSDATMQTVNRGKVWVMKIPKAMAEEIKAKGQPLPSILLPLTGAGLALMASHKRDQK